MTLVWIVSFAKLEHVNVILTPLECNLKSNSEMVYGKVKNHAGIQEGHRHPIWFLNILDERFQKDNWVWTTGVFKGCRRIDPWMYSAVGVLLEKNQ